MHCDSYTLLQKQSIIVCSRRENNFKEEIFSCNVFFIQITIKYIFGFRFFIFFAILLKKTTWRHRIVTVFGLFVELFSSNENGLWEPYEHDQPLRSWVTSHLHQIEDETDRNNKTCPRADETEREATIDGVSDSTQRVIPFNKVVRKSAYVKSLGNIMLFYSSAPVQHNVT